MKNKLNIIETERLILREWTLDDVDALVDGLGKFEVAKNLTIPFPYTEKDAIEFVNSHNKNSDTKCYFAVVLKDSGEVIGGTNISINSEDNSNAGGIWLNQKFQEKGYGTEIFMARAKFAFEVLKVDKLFNGYYDFNVRSAKMQQKLGYEVVGEQQRFCPALNKEVREIRTILTKEKFESLLKNIDKQK